MTEFLVVALVVTLTPGPGTATILRVAARQILTPKVQAGLERFTGAVMVGLGVRLATESS